MIGNEMDVTEAQALSYQDDTVSVYSNSWGPSDNGYVVEGPGVLVQQTLSQAVVKVSTCEHSDYSFMYVFPLKLLPLILNAFRFEIILTSNYTCDYMCIPLGNR